MSRQSLRLLLVTARVGASGCAAVPIGAMEGQVVSRFRGEPLEVVAAEPSREAPAAEPYVVQPGDTLWSLSRRYGTSVDDLLEANDLDSPQSLRAGQPLELPQDLAPPAGPRLDKAGPTDKVRPGAYPLRWPVTGAITSRFGKRGRRQHDGIDISAARGAEVKAAADGEVLFAARQGGYGNLVLVRHAGGMVTVYAHNERNLVHKGQRVRAGQAIARVGQTGRATGPHLHFEVRRGVAPLNPLRFLPP